MAALTRKALVCGFGTKVLCMNGDPVLSRIVRVIGRLHAAPQDETPPRRLQLSHSSNNIAFVQSQPLRPAPRAL